MAMQPIAMISETTPSIYEEPYLRRDQSRETTPGDEAHLEESPATWKSVKISLWSNTCTHDEIMLT